MCTPGYEDDLSRMHQDLKHLLLDSLTAGHILSEAELDGLVEAGGGMTTHPIAQMEVPPAPGGSNLLDSLQQTYQQNSTTLCLHLP